MNMKKFRKFIKFINYILLPFKLILDKIRSSTTYKIIRGIIKLYAIIFVILGSGIMGLTEIDFRGYSELVHHNLEYYFSTISDSLKRFFNWISRKIFGSPKTETTEESLAEIAKRVGIDLEELKARNSKVDRIIDYNSPDFGLFKEGELEEKSTSHIKTTIIVISIIGAALGGFYYFRPDEFNSYCAWISGGIAAILHGRNNDGGSGPEGGSPDISNSNVNPISPTASTSTSSNSDITVKDTRTESVETKESDKSIINHNVPLRSEKAQLALTVCKSAISLDDDGFSDYVKNSGNHVIHNSLTNQYQTITELREWIDTNRKTDAFKARFSNNTSLEEICSVITKDADKYQMAPMGGEKPGLLSGLNKFVELTTSKSDSGNIRSTWLETASNINTPKASTSTLPVDGSAAILITGHESDEESVWSSETPKSKTSSLPVEVQDNGKDNWVFDSPPKSPETFTPKIVEEINQAAVTQTMTPPDSVIGTPNPIRLTLVDHEYPEVSSPLSDNSISKISTSIFNDGYESDASSDSSSSSSSSSDQSFNTHKNHWSDDDLLPKERIKRDNSEYLKTKGSHSKFSNDRPFEDPFA